MDSGELLLVFAALMLVISMLAIGVDWVGKPLRHRRFAPRIYRYPDELAVTDLDPSRTGFSDDAFVLPQALPEGVPFVDTQGVSEWSSAHFVLPGPEASADTWGTLIAENPTSENPVFEALVNVETWNTYERSIMSSETMPASPPEFPPTQEVEAIQMPVKPVDAARPSTTFQSLVASTAHTDARRILPSEATSEPGIWKPGDPLWTKTKNGTTPSATTLRRRFWQSASVLIPNVRWYGEENLDRMVHGKAPQRRNRRTGKVETMQLAGLKSAADAGAARPRWPGTEIDPFLEG